jgi:hypothetical protein
MLNIIFFVTLKKIAIEYTQKEMRKDLNRSLQHLLNIKEVSNMGNEEWQQITDVRSPFLSGITLILNGLNFLVKRQRYAHWIKTYNPIFATYKRRLCFRYNNSKNFLITVY